MELHKLKSAMLVSLDLSYGGSFDVRKLLGVDDEDSFYHVVPVRLGYCFPDSDYTGTKTYQAKLSVNEPMPAEQWSQQKFWIAEIGEFVAYSIDHARGLINTNTYLTEMQCYIVAYGK